MLFDGVVVPGGTTSVETLAANADARDFVEEAYKHCKPIGALGVNLLRAARVRTGNGADAPRVKGAVSAHLGVVIADEADTRAFISALVDAIAPHRHWGRGDEREPVPEANRPRGRAR